MESSSNGSDLRFDFSIDRGGTFTDIYCEILNQKTQNRSQKVMKLLSVDPNNYRDAPTEGIRRIIEECVKITLPKDQKIPTSQINSIRMGTTVATNALLERKGDKVALFVSQGLRDTLSIGNQQRPKIFDLKIQKPEQIFQEIVEVTERIRPLKQFERELTEFKDLVLVEGLNQEQFVVVQKLDLQKVQQDLQRIKEQGIIESISVVLMHSYSFTDHELQIGEIAKKVGFTQVSLSHQVMQRIKFVKRGQTCCVNAYLNPKIMRYIEGFKDGFDDKLLDRVAVFFMQSDGGLAHIDDFSGSKAILSGPAGGVVGYSITGIQHQKRYQDRYNLDKQSDPVIMPMIGFDMGGTSTDVSRFESQYEHVFETELAGVSIQAPQLNINTVAAGGGSKLYFQHDLYKVGPESVGADPGPVCYRKKGGELAITDANLVLGRLLPEYFPHIFGQSEKEPLDLEGSLKAFELLVSQINKSNVQHNIQEVSLQEAALGFIRVANETMCRPIRQLTQARGFNPKNHILSIFGGAGGQHACAIAKELGINQILIQRYCGILSAYGLRLADVVQENELPLLDEYSPQIAQNSTERFDQLKNQNIEKLSNLGFKESQIEHYTFLNLRYDGTDTSIMVETPRDNNYKEQFQTLHQREFGFTLQQRKIFVDNIRVRSIGKSQTVHAQEIEKAQNNEQPTQLTKVNTYYDLKGEQEESSIKAQSILTPVFDLTNLKSGMKIQGPAIILNNTSTILVEPNWTSLIDDFGNVLLTVVSDQFGQTGIYKTYKSIEEVPLDSIELSIFGHRFMSIAEQMGLTLQKTSVSTNIKERLDFSCALFDHEGNLVANAPHLPVHLGSMQNAVRYQIQLLGDTWKEGEVILANHPSAGGTHLPDITVITPVFEQGNPVFYVASRGHHADIGGIQAGSMPSFSKTLEEEGAAIKCFKLVKDSQFQEEGITELLCNQSGLNPRIRGTRNLNDNLSDLKAQVAANQRGISLVKHLIDEYSLIYVQAYMKYIQANAEQCVKQMLRELSLNQNLKEVDTVRANDFMDDGSEIKLALTIDRIKMEATFDFEGTDPEMYGNCNAPNSITYSAIIYCLRCLLNSDIPLNQGCLKPIKIIVPENTFINPSPTAAVVGGNVLTSQRVTDVVLKAFRACAASYGCMNNFTFGDDNFGYYETIGGGSGAGPSWNGKDAVQCHMTNTRITDPEILEIRYPVLLRQFNIRWGSGGKGLFNGGNGIIRELEFLKDGIEVGILSERRAFEPWGLEGGENGARGKNYIEYADGRIQNFGAKNSTILNRHCRIRIMTPSGGGYGKKQDN